MDSGRPGGGSPTEQSSSTLAETKSAQVSVETGGETQ